MVKEFSRKVAGLMVAVMALNTPVFAQYWQQKVEYTMNIDFNAEKHQFSGTQKLVYYNNSPDALDKVFYHLYFNAFQPGSMMDVRSRTISDPDRRVRDRIAGLSPEEIGYHKIISLSQDGKKVDFHMEGTILEVTLNKPIKPGEKAEFNMVFESQVPIQIRRSGRDNAEGVAYSMAQWYPKMAEYDKEGWHANPYIGREFHGVWGNFDVTINIDSAFVLGGTGYLQNPQEIGHGYQEAGQKVNRKGGDQLSWRFIAPNVHDFAWAADKDYTHLQAKVPGGPTIHFLYLSDSVTEPNWTKLPDLTVKAFQLMNERFGKYPYKQYSVIQGGDGGMEYPMATLISGRGSMGGLVSVTVHEFIHSWYYGLLATNEAKYPWMDEGFTTFAQNYVLDKLYERNRLNPQFRSQSSYLRYARSGKQEPITTHADHYHTNSNYSISSYSKGAVFLDQLRYIIGQNAFNKGMLRYFDEWAFKHPTPDDFKRVMERTSGLELDWYFEQFIGTTNTVDYGIRSVTGQKKGVEVTLQRLGHLTMPQDLYVTLKSGQLHVYHIPLRIMRGHKPAEGGIENYHLATDWPWTHPEYTLTLPFVMDDIEKLELDASSRMADIDRSNNQFPSESSIQMEGEVK